jgi:hypothetical protein
LKRGGPVRGTRGPTLKKAEDDVQDIPEQKEPVTKVFF